MIVRPTSDLKRHVIHACSKVRFASTAARKPKPGNPDHGQHIYVYRQFQTNQIVYSLTSSLKNNASLRQLPFNGKKTVARALRKDLWAPFVLISFPQGGASVGLSAFQKLREYRRLHELLWDESLRKDKDGGTITKKALGRKLLDQKANSVADIATVLKKIGTPEGKEIGLKGFKGAEEGSEVAPQIEVRWSELVDAQFAESWSQNVIHDKLEWESHVKEISELASQRRSNARRERQARSRAFLEESKRKIKAEKHELHMATKAEKHANYLESRGISEEQYQVELQALLKAKAERQQNRLAEKALPEAERKAIRAERKRAKEQAEAEAASRLEKITA